MKSDSRSVSQIFNFSTKELALGLFVKVERARMIPGPV